MEWKKGFRIMKRNWTLDAGFYLANRKGCKRKLWVIKNNIIDLCKGKWTEFHCLNPPSMVEWLDKKSKQSIASLSFNSQRPPLILMHLIITFNFFFFSFFCTIFLFTLTLIKGSQILRVQSAFVSIARSIVVRDNLKKKKKRKESKLSLKPLEPANEFCGFHFIVQYLWNPIKTKRHSLEQ